MRKSARHAIETEDLCGFCERDLGLVPPGKVCCRLLKLNGQHEPRTTEWKGENESGFTREIKQTSGSSYEATGRLWCAIRDWCQDWIGEPGSTPKCCATHREFYRNSQAKRKGKKTYGEPGENPVSGGMTKAQLLEKLHESQHENASLHQQLKRKRIEADDLQAEVKRLRGVARQNVNAMAQSMEAAFLTATLTAQDTQVGLASSNGPNIERSTSDLGVICDFDDYFDCGSPWLGVTDGHGEHMYSNVNTVTAEHDLGEYDQQQDEAFNRMQAFSQVKQELAVKDDAEEPQELLPSAMPLASSGCSSGSCMVGGGAARRRSARLAR